ncbi:hypothetical protein N7492_009312 [Penicillium capsulatum]|uniref:DNA endonuclease activator Ctp1 C-terminal domain-containing protein n=1 Tax=Penicillium capsulatum TaxID=69766 RepID=A0A9W9LHM6_9EURO|nr:hypothetical protein N7492_009312 [Penicillium capsulatum]KAJ6106706.1 hypothetical protein N7512_010223 [Penicillium capsulatum]
MDILKELHLSVAEACEASFDNAYKDLELQLSRQEAELKEANQSASIANQARQAAEHQFQKLQRENLALQDALKTYEASSEQVEPCLPFPNLGAEFAPEHVWHEGLSDVNELQRILQSKYSALYNNLQTLMAGWNGLKTKVLQHKKKLRNWEKQLQRDEFTLLLHGAPVTFQRAHSIDAVSKIRTAHAQGGNIGQLSCSEPSEVSHVTPKSLCFGQNGESTTPRARIKTEPNSQQVSHAHPVQLSSNSSHLGHDSVDPEPSSDPPHPLPDLQSRKRRRVQQPSHAHPTGSVPQRPVLVKNEPVSSSPIQSSTHSPGQPLMSTQDLDDIGDTVQTPTKRHAARDVRLGGPNPASNPGHAPVKRNEQGQFSQDPSALQPINGNAHVFKHKDQGQMRNRRAALSMAEDADDDDDYEEQPSKATSKHTRAMLEDPSRKGKDTTTPTQSRLQGLLEGSTTPKTPLLASKTEDLIRPKVRGPVGSSHTRHPLQPNENAPEVRPEDEPYRLWPLHRLNLDHFKINTARNQGFDFAYDSVTRKKDERKCLSGCTRPGCCGDRFRAMARLGGLTANSATEQAEEDQRVLEDYMGNDRRKVNELSAHDREKLLVDARARVLANQYGRHRHNHQRAQSPPGFWRTDMPSTQEMESDREAAQQQERAKVEERYREAMRPGGLWMFADE